MAVERDGLKAALSGSLRAPAAPHLYVPGDCVARNRGAHFVRPCPVALRRNKALHLTARPSSLRLAVRSAGERRDFQINVVQMFITRLQPPMDSVPMRVRFSHTAKTLTIHTLILNS
jgi:hypothetical protein